MTAARSDEWDDGAPWVDGCSLRHEAIKVTSKPYIYTGWWLTYPSEKYAFVNWDDYSSQDMENKKCSKPPVFIYIYMLLFNEIS